MKLRKRTAAGLHCAAKCWFYMLTFACGMGLACPGPAVGGAGLPAGSAERSAPRALARELGHQRRLNVGVTVAYAFAAQYPNEVRRLLYFEHFWNDFAADPTRSMPEADRRIYAADFARSDGLEAGFECFRTFEQDAFDFEALSRTALTMPILVVEPDAPRAY